jgi:hypothetical protein
MVLAWSKSASGPLSQAQMGFKPGCGPASNSWQAFECSVIRPNSVMVFNKGYCNKGNVIRINGADRNRLSHYIKSKLLVADDEEERPSLVNPVLLQIRLTEGTNDERGKPNDKQSSRPAPR